MPPLLGDGHFNVATTGGVHAVDPASGEHRWTVDAPLAAGMYPEFAIYDSLLIAPGGTEPGGIPDGLVGIDLADRSVRWENTYGLSFGTPRVAVGKDAMYDVRLERVVELDPATGDYLEDTVVSLPDDQFILGYALNDSVLYATSGLTVYALDLSAGSVRWQRRVQDLPDPIGPGTRHLEHVVAGHALVAADDVAD
ncbi:MAG: PQQ-binding-like beta-propeller repeat protein, partial [Halobacteriaceae archaeon]